MANKLTEQQQLLHQQQLLQQQLLGQQLQQQPAVTSLPQSQVPQVHSLSSSTTSNQPMNSIPPTHTTSSVPMTMAYQGQGHIPSPAYQPVSAALTSAQLLPAARSSVPPPGPVVLNGFGEAGYAPGQGQTVSGVTATATPHIPTPVATPTFVGALSADGHAEQMKRVRDYQQYLLARHEQSKRVLAETKEEIKRRRDNLMQRYPKLDLTRLEDLGAKYLDNKTEEQVLPEQVSMAVPAGGQGQVAFTTADSQVQSVPVTALLASLASHPYYAQTLAHSMPAGVTTIPNGVVNNGTVGAVTSVAQPDINFETNLRKNKFDTIRKSLPFDTDESFQSPSVRIYDAYTSKQLDSTTGTETTEADTSTSTERGSPKLKTPAKFQPLAEESEGDSSTPVSVTSEPDSLTARQEELLHQLADIQRQKEEIIQRHAMGQERVQQKQDQLKAKLATVSTAEQQAQLRDTFRKVVEDRQVSVYVQLL